MGPFSQGKHQDEERIHQSLATSVCFMDYIYIKPLSRDAHLVLSPHRRGLGHQRSSSLEGKVVAPSLLQEKISTCGKTHLLIDFVSAAPPKNWLRNYSHLRIRANAGTLCREARYNSIVTPKLG